MHRRETIRLWLNWGLAVGYLSLSVGFLGANALGYSAGGMFAYFFTWDMFPHFQPVSQRRVALGETRSGKFVLLHPSDRQQFREGVVGDMSRADLDRGGVYFRTIVEVVRQRTRGERVHDPLVTVSLFEQTWPVKYNLDDALYFRWMGEPKPFDVLERERQNAVSSPPVGIPRAHWHLTRKYPVHEDQSANQRSEP